MSEALDIPLGRMKTKFKRTTNSYITICNEAWGEAPTKTWYQERWKKVIEFIIYHAQLDAVFQIGEFRTETMTGCTNLTGTQNLRSACEIVAGSKFHLGIEGFWNHFCKALEIPAVIIFGPTPSSFFGYQEISNIQSEVCSNCWWQKKTWMLECPKGFSINDRPCMNDVTVERVIQKVIEEL
jgi:ADP-heptose:LPS heptosyltransferase